jgi:hypothetical protein
VRPLDRWATFKEPAYRMLPLWVEEADQEVKIKEEENDSLGGYPWSVETLPTLVVKIRRPIAILDEDEEKSIIDASKIKKVNLIVKEPTKAKAFFDYSQIKHVRLLVREPAKVKAESDTTVAPSTPRLTIRIPARAPCRRVNVKVRITQAKQAKNLTAWSYGKVGAEGVVEKTKVVKKAKDRRASPY